MPGVEFRRAGEADIPLLQALARSIWMQHYPGMVTVAQIEYMLAKMYGAETLAAEMRNGVCFEVVAAEEKPVGYLAYFSEPDGKAVKLSKLYLEAAFRGRGIGRAMLERVLAAARKMGAGEIYLTVNKGNLSSIAAYEKFGFLRAESVVAEVGNGFVMDDYVMRLSLG